MATIKNKSKEPALKTPAERMHQFFGALRRRWAAAAAVFVLTVVSAFAFTALQHPTYEATAQILIQPTDRDAQAIHPDVILSPANAERDFNTLGQLITVDPVADAVRRQLGLSSGLSELTSQISVSGQDTSNLVTITAEDDSPRRAAELATAFATQYRSYRRRTALAEIKSAISNARAAPGGLTPGSSVAERVQQLRAAAAVETGGVQIIRSANIPTAAASPHLLTRILVAIFVAALLAIAAVFGLEAVDRRLVNEEDFETAFGAPVIAALPATKPGQLGRSEDEAVRQQAYTDVAARLSFTSLGQHRRTIMIAPASPRDEARGAAQRLSTALSELGRRVVLIDADLRTPRANDGARSQEPGGLTAILSGESTFDRELMKVHSATESRGKASSLSVLPAGSPVELPEALVGRVAMREVVGLARDYAEIVLIQAPPLERAGVVLPLAQLCDGVLVVARPRSFSARKAQEAVELLRTVAAPIFGIVLEPIGAVRLSGSKIIAGKETFTARPRGTESSNGRNPHRETASRGPGG